jgi:hypothetical protein
MTSPSFRRRIALTLEAAILTAGFGARPGTAR